MKRSPLKRGTSVLKRTPLARVGWRKRNEQLERSHVIRTVHARDVRCQFLFWALQAKMDDKIGKLEDPIPCWNPEGSGGDVHEIIARSVWPKGYLDPDNCVLLCRAHHEWLDAHRAQAEAIGLYGRTKP